MRVSIVLPRGMRFSPEGATSIDLVARDLILASRYRETTTVIGAAVDNPFPDVPFRSVVASSQRSMVAGCVDRLKVAEPDVIVVHQHPESAAAIARALPHVPVVLHRHGLLKRQKTFLSRWRRARQLARIRRVIFVSEFIRSTFLEDFPGVADRSEVIPNGVDTGLWLPGPKEQRITYVGRARADKGIGELLDAFLGLDAPGWTLSLVMSVQTEEEAAFARSIEARAGGRTDIEVHRSLTIDAVRAELARSAIAALPSIVREGFPRAVVEAMSCGCAVIAGNGGGTPEAAGPAALLMDRISADTVREALAPLVSDAEDCRARGEAARAHATGHLDLAVVARRYDDLLQRMAAKGQSR